MGNFSKTKFNIKKTYIFRLQDLLTLRDLRINEPHDSWCRKRMTFFYRHFALMADYDYKEALEMTKEFNKSFKEPIDLDMIEMYSKSAEINFNNGIYYHHTTERVMEELQITNDEISHMKTLIDKETRQRRYNHRGYLKVKKTRSSRDGLTAKQQEIKEDRQLVAELYNKGFTQSQIAKETGFSLGRVRWLRYSRKQ